VVVRPAGLAIATRKSATQRSTPPEPLADTSPDRRDPPARDPPDRRRPRIGPRQGEPAVPCWVACRDARSRASGAGSGDTVDSSAGAGGDTLTRLSLRQLATCAGFGAARLYRGQSRRPSPRESEGSHPSRRAGLASRKMRCQISRFGGPRADRVVCRCRLVLTDERSRAPVRTFRARGRRAEDGGADERRGSARGPSDRTAPES